MSLFENEAPKGSRKSGVPSSSCPSHCSFFRIGAVVPSDDRKCTFQTVNFKNAKETCSFLLHPREKRSRTRLGSEICSIAVIVLRCAMRVEGARCTEWALSEYESLTRSALLRVGSGDSSIAIHLIFVDNRVSWTGSSPEKSGLAGELGRPARLVHYYWSYSRIFVDAVLLDCFFFSCFSLDGIGEAASFGRRINFASTGD